MRKSSHFILTLDSGRATPTSRCRNVRVIIHFVTVKAPEVHPESQDHAMRG